MVVLLILGSKKRHQLNKVQLIRYFHLVLVGNINT